MGEHKEDHTEDHGDGTATRRLKYSWNGNMFGVNDKQTYHVPGTITYVGHTNDGGESKIKSGGEGHKHVEINHHSGGGTDGGTTNITITYRKN